MAKVPYGFDARMPNADDEPWTKLATIAEYLEDCEVIPPDLAMWLGVAIRHSKQDSSELMRLLGLIRKRGKPAADSKAWLKYGEKVCELEDSGVKPEAAITQVLAELNDGNGGKYSRQQMQKLRDTYRKALHESQQA